MLKISKQSGFASFTEIIIATSIFMITAVGIYSTIAMISPKAAESTRKLEAANAARSFIDQLLYEVSAPNWYAASPGSSNLVVGHVYTRDLDNNMHVSYMLTDVDPSIENGGSPRYLTLNITY